MAISTEDLLRDAQALAARLPAGRHLLNLCRDRYAFTVAFLAALLRDQVCLLTGERSVEVLTGLAADFPGCILAMDEGVAAHEVPAGLPLQLVQPGHAGAGPPAPGEAAANPVIPAERLAAIVFTSGSTGRPVGHPKRWGALAERSRAAGLWLGLSEAEPVTVIGTVPPQHMYGFETTVLLPLHAPTASWCGPAFFPEDVRAALAAVPAPRLLVTTPLQLSALLRAGSGMPDLRAVVSATAPLGASLAAQAETRWQTRVLEIFGATEVGSIASRRTLDGDVWATYPGVALLPGAEGVDITAPHAVPVPLDDQVEALGPDRFRLIGRRTDIVKLGGHRASLAGLNRILVGLEGVEDGAFFLPEAESPSATARLLALVVAPQRSADSILQELRGRMHPLFLPRRVILVPALPRNEMGKLPRTRVLDLLAQLDACASGAA